MKFKEFNVLPNLPEKLKPLLEIASNLWWAWDSETFSLYREIDEKLWSELSHNPVKLLYRVPQERLDALSHDDGFLFRVENAKKKLDQYMSRKTWFDKISGDKKDPVSIAYFSLEFGLAECLPVYSGGLGVLAGDHLKSASDLGLPLTGIGLLYTQGYFHQYLTNDGWQQERYLAQNYTAAPITHLKDENNNEISITVNLPDGPVRARIWQVNVGRIKLLLLDTNMPENSPADREITAKLYGGDLEMRIKQEMILGIGGMRALYALGLKPAVTHMNEGHSAFLSLERIRILMNEQSLTFEEAREIAAASSVFTTHTPVPAGNDRFSWDLMDKYMRKYVEEELKLDFETFFNSGRVNSGDTHEWFCMTVLALRLSAYSNGVSRLHGHVSRKMWQDIWPVSYTHLTLPTKRIV